MKVAKTKIVTLREFQHRLSDISGTLNAGESVFITKRGRPLGVFTKTPIIKKAPDYMANLEKLGYSTKAGQKYIDEICDLS
jgi:antitoxin (DNA-binding transcriptional repressor) of toxin-antitoxin stability system